MIKKIGFWLLNCIVSWRLMDCVLVTHYKHDAETTLIGYPVLYGGD